MDTEIVTEPNRPFLKTCLELSSKLQPYQKEPSVSRTNGRVSWRDSLTDENTGTGVDTEICATSDGVVLWQKAGFRFPRPPELEGGTYSKTHYPKCYATVVWDRADSQLSATLWLTKSHMAPLMSQPLLMEVAAYEVRSLSPETLNNLHQTTRGLLENENSQLAKSTLRLLKSLVAAEIKYGKRAEDRPTI